MEEKILKNYVYGTILIAILLGGAFFVTPLVFADDEEDLKKLKGQVANILEDRKCKNKKYGGICDLTRPNIKINLPARGAKVPAGSVTISGTASDTGSGIDNVKIKLNFGPYEVASYDSGAWETTKILNPGFYIVVARAEDKVDNVGFDASYFTVIP